jgi:hypothetical protein
VKIPSWNNLFTKLKHDDYPKSTPHSDLQLREVDDVVFHTIDKSMLHFVTMRASVMHCIQLMEWVISHTKSLDCKIVNGQGECIGSFLSQYMAICYKLIDPNESLTKDFVISFYEQYETNKILKKWWKEDIKFVKISTCKYAISSLREPYMYTMTPL